MAGVRISISDDGAYPRSAVGCGTHGLICAQHNSKRATHAWPAFLAARLVTAPDGAWFDRWRNARALWPGCFWKC